LERELFTEADALSGTTFTSKVLVPEIPSAAKGFLLPSVGVILKSSTEAIRLVVLSL